jgi:hypothetical protein
MRVTLAGEAVRIRFVQVHFDDLRTIFGNLPAKAQSNSK